MDRHLQQDESRGRTCDAAMAADGAGTALLVSIDACSRPASRALVGGKAHALQRIAFAGLETPAARVLTSAFFAPWYDALDLPRRIRADASDPSWADAGEALAREALVLPLSPAQADALKRLCADCKDPPATYAVRSSGADEDMPHASFAGMYRTRLGVYADAIEEAVRDCFAASLRSSVLAYQHAHRLDTCAPRFALIVQPMVHADVAGVAFSIDPLTNDYDHAAIAASWGLGESVVAGLVSADHIVVDRRDGSIVRAAPGSKQHAVVVSPEGGTCTVERAQDDRLSLTLTQLEQLRAALDTLEHVFGGPADVEWAFADGRLHILQSRPVTAWVPLPDAMRSAPDAPRTLYMDIALSKGLTTNAPLSPMGTDWLRATVRQLLARCCGRDHFDLDDPHGLVFFAGGRMYMNLSNMLWLASPAQLAQSSAATDRLMADTLATVDAAKYRAPRRPPWRMAILRMAPRALWRLRRPLLNAARAMLAPQRAHRRYAAVCAGYEAALAAEPDWTLAPAEFRARYGAPAIATLVDEIMPTMGAGIAAIAGLKRLARRHSDEERALVDVLTRGVGGNVVVEMGQAMHRMSTMLAPADFADIDALAARIRDGDVPAGFLRQWHAFVARWGCRGPGEMDLGRPHYGDDAVLLLGQMAHMARGIDPTAVHARLAAERGTAFAELERRFGPLRRALLRWLDRIATRFAGARDTPKYYTLLYQRLAREHVLRCGRRLHAQGRLDSPAQVFDLVADDLAAAEREPSINLRTLAVQRSAFVRSLELYVRTFPAVIDSRGRIHRAPARHSADGALVGMPVSAGRACGPARVLHHADANAMQPGDILIAFTTDPGWTPLFVNAAAIVLEVGGVLQHGALVAREYGKPCVVGIPGITQRVRDGQRLEVDGATGLIRILEDAT